MSIDEAISHFFSQTLRKSNLLDIVHLYDREVELFYEEQILENKKEYSKSWSKIMLVVMEFDSKSLPTSPSGNLSSSNYDLSGAAGARLKDKDRQAIKDKFHVSSSGRCPSCFLLTWFRF